MNFNFEESPLLKLSPAEAHELTWLEPLLISSEKPLLCFKSARDGVCFSSKRLLLYNSKGLSGKSTSVATIPYESITSYVMSGGGLVDTDIELTLYVREAGKCTLSIVRDFSDTLIHQLLSRALLSSN